MAKTWALKDAGIMIRTIEKEQYEAARRGLLSAGHRVVGYIVGTVIPGIEPHPPVGQRGLYRAGWRARRDGDAVVVENIAPYAAVIEDGIRPGRLHPGKALIEALTKWVQWKGFGGRTVTSAGGKTRHVKATSTEARSIAFAIVAATFKKGRPGLHVLKKAEPAIPRMIREEVLAELRRGR